MRRFLVFLMFVTLVAGCDDESSTGPTGPSLARVVISGLPDSIWAPEGWAVDLPLSVYATDRSGNPAPGTPVDLVVSTGLGSLEPPRVTTGVNARGSSSWRFAMPRGLQKVQVSAYANGVSARAMVTLHGTGIPASVRLTTETPRVTLPSGGSANITLKAEVADSNGNLLEGIPLTFRLAGFDAGLPVGAVTGEAITDKDGTATVEYRSLGEFGVVRVLAIAANPDGTERAVGSQDLTVVRLEGTVGRIELAVEPSQMRLEPGADGAAQLSALVIDRSGNRVPNIQVTFQADQGVVQTYALTNAEGIARAEYHSGGNAVGTVNVTASIAGTDVSAEARLLILRPLEGAHLEISSDRGAIFADNGQTVVNLIIYLRDSDGQRLAGREITFRSQFGITNGPVMTDDYGVARAIYSDIGMPSVDERGNPIPDVVVARCLALGIEASVEITILPRSPVNSVSLRAGAVQMIAGRGDSTAVVATCLLANGAFAPAGTFVIFDVDEGRFSSAGVPVVGTSGQAETKYIAGTLVGTAHLTASVTNRPPDSNEVVSNIVEIQLIPGPPSQIRVTTDRPILITNDLRDFATIRALVTDTFGFPVRQGTLVNFTTDLGNLTGSAALTDSTGSAYARLFSGVASGRATVRASVTLLGGRGTIYGETVVEFIPGSPASLVLTAESSTIQVRGSGGGRESTRLTANIRDASGNPVETATTVVFQLVRSEAPPIGGGINGRGQIDSMVAVGGSATATIFSGTRIGSMLLRIYTWRDIETRQDTISAFINIAVVSGPPFSMEIDAGRYGDDLGGALWQIPVSARVWDLHRNPTSSNAVVVFTVDPPIATIEAAPIENGVVLTWLVYHSQNTFQDITIAAEVNTPGGLVTGEMHMKLPLQRGRLELAADPGNWMIDDNPNLLVRVWATLVDGHGVLINKAPIRFTTTRSRYWWYDLQARNYREFFPDRAIKLTGVVDARNNEPDGVATVFLRGTIDDFFLDPFTLEVSVRLDAVVDGYEEAYARPVTILVSRHG
ncbi:MAG: hypothetical protein FJY67_06265 [Calditrichaeota bacterium]|nr:hypothetical protein [Calditrichota bacterium]